MSEKGTSLVHKFICLETIERFSNDCRKANTYILLTKRKVKMAGYWPRSLFAF